MTIRVVIYSTTLLMSHKYLRFLISRCDLIDSISMWLDCRKFRKCVNEVKKTRDDREIEKSKIKKKYARHRTCESLSRTYIDVKSAELSELTSYVIQKALLLLCEIEMYNDCIVRFFKTILSDIKKVLVVLNTLCRSDIDLTSKHISDYIIRSLEAILFVFKSWRIDCTLSRNCIVQ